MQRFLDEGKTEALNKLFGDSEWERIRESKTREDDLLNLYEKKLQKECSIKHVIPFNMIGEHNNSLYHLIFCTNHVSGIKEMKKAMWSVDKTGGYSFSDTRDPTQTYIFSFCDDEHWIPEVANKIYKEFSGKRISVSEIETFVLCKTYYRFLKSILKYIEEKHPEWIKEIDTKGEKRKYQAFKEYYDIIFN
jgi:hypothetical protein